MKVLLKTLLAGFLVFMVLAIGQEWAFFRDAWFGEPEADVELPYDDLTAAAESVRLTLSLMRHFYMSGGDPRFAERMPAADWVVDEMRQDIDYLRRNGRLQDASLDQLELLSVEPVAADRVEIRTREFWTVRIVWAVDGRETQPARSQVSHGLYRAVRTGQGWRVEQWGPALPGAPDEEPPG